MNIKFRCKILASVLMVVSMLMAVGNLSAVHGMKRAVPDYSLADGSVNSSGAEGGSEYSYSRLSYREMALHEDWFGLLGGGDIPRLNNFLEVHGKDCLNWRNSADVLPLNYAASKCSADVVRFLLDNGADPNTVCQSNRTPLLCAVQRVISGFDPIEGPHVIDVILDPKYYADVDAGDSKGYTALHWAAIAGDLELCKKLMDCCADENAVSLDGYTPNTLYNLYHAR